MRSRRSKAIAELLATDVTAREKSHLSSLTNFILWMDSFQLFEWKGWHRSFKWRLALRPAVWKRIICLSGIFNEQFSMNNLCNSSTWFKCGSSSTLCLLRWPSAHLMSYFFPSRWVSFLSLFTGSPRWIFDVKNLNLRCIELSLLVCTA